MRQEFAQMARITVGLVKGITINWKYRGITVKKFSNTDAVPG
jgi:hypothetical protein